MARLKPCAYNGSELPHYKEGAARGANRISDHEKQ
jgi:hypothetical protein